MKTSDTERLQKEYRSLVEGLQVANPLPDDVLANPLLPADILQEAVPGSIRRAEHFVVFLKKIIEFMKVKISATNVEKLSPLGFLRELYDKTALERKPLKFTANRLNKLLLTLEITSLDDFSALNQVGRCSVV